MKQHFLFFLLLCLSANTYAQSDAYFQQEVNYKINVTLDDVAHTLTGDIDIEYTNNSPHSLDTIFFHLWGNAFSKIGTAYDQQKLRNGSSKFYFADEKDRGGYAGLDWSVDGSPAEFSLTKNDPDIGILHLPKALETGGTVTIRTPFTLKVPISFSRLGHVKTSYQMTQWYPKPAVFDHKGWHQMPYLDMGEFYSEFGNFDVTITLPENYVVGASGVCQTASEIEFLRSKVGETQELVENGFPEKDTFPASGSTMKTIRYVAEQVHDFAWFADKRFHVLHDEASLASGKKIDCWAMFINREADLWTRGAEYVKRAVEFYSQHVGEYPWPQATAVHSALSAGGGMEYPMITVIGNSGNARALDDVITHEVGHNWFYGILASNERDHAWMDEGMNSYYEYRYMRQYYGDRVDVGLPKFLTGGTDIDLFELAYLFNARRNLDQAPSCHSNCFTQANYMLGAYVKPGSVLGHLEGYLGTEEYDRVMKKYYDTWKFRHPYPEDFRKLVEAETGKDLGWFFDDYLYSTKKLDYSLQLTSKAVDGWQIQVRNEGEIAAPFPISGLKNGEVVERAWFEPIEHEAIVNFPEGNFDQFILDEGHVTLDVWRRNNNIRTKGAFKDIEPLKVNFLGIMENPRRRALNLFPTVGWNKYDGAMLGIGIHNGLLPARNLEFQWAPLYGFKSNELVGMLNLRYNIFPKSEKIRKISFGLSSKAFSYDYRPPYERVDTLGNDLGFPGTHLQYQRIVPSVKIELRRSPTSHFYQTIELSSNLLQVENTKFDTAGIYVGNEFDDRIINRLTWEFGDRRELNPYSFRFGLEHQNSEVRVLDSNPTRFENQNYLKATFELNTSYTYDRGRSFDVRLFTGKFFHSSDRDDAFSYFPEAFSMTGEGFNDYHYDELYFGRTESDGLLAQQIAARDGGMKVALGGARGQVAGRSNSFMFALNVVTDLPQDLPGKLPLRPYFDLGYYQDNRPIASDLSSSDRLWWQGGVTLELSKGLIGVHFPVVNSSNVKDLYDQSGRGKFYERITFQLDLRKINPWKLTDEVEF